MRDAGQVFPELELTARVCAKCHEVIQDTEWACYHHTGCYHQACCPVCRRA